MNEQKMVQHRDEILTQPVLNVNTFSLERKREEKVYEPLYLG